VERGVGAERRMEGRRTGGPAGRQGSAYSRQKGSVAPARWAAWRVEPVAGPRGGHQEGEAAGGLSPGLMVFPLGPDVVGRKEGLEDGAPKGTLSPFSLDLVVL